MPRLCKSWRLRTQAMKSLGGWRSRIFVDSAKPAMYKYWVEALLLVRRCSFLCRIFSAVCNALWVKWWAPSGLNARCSKSLSCRQILNTIFLYRLCSNARFPHVAYSASSTPAFLLHLSQKKNLWGTSRTAFSGWLPPYDQTVSV